MKSTGKALVILVSTLEATTMKGVKAAVMRRPLVAYNIAGQTNE
jgi:hypothetical protein